MWYPRTYASRLALAVLTTFATIQVLLSALFLIAREAEIREDFDARLALRAASAADAAEAEYYRTGGVSLASRAAPPARSFALLSAYWQLGRLDGTVVERAPELRGLTLPRPPLDTFETDVEATHLDTWSDPAVRAVLGGSGELRIVSRLVLIEGSPAFVVQVARDLEPVASSLASLRRQLLLALALGLLLSGLASWVLARRVQRGIMSIVQQARDLSPDAPQRRIDAGAGGGELRQLASNLNVMLDGLEQALRSREQFLADISHELKAPLAALAADTRMMAAAARTSDICRELDNAVQSVVSSLTGTADALLMLAKCSEGTVGPIAARTALNEVVTDAVAKCLAHARARSVRLIPTLADNEDPEVDGHADLLRLTLENLIRNAVEHSPEGAPVRVSLSQAGGRARIAVADAGPGVKAELLPHVFERFVSGRPGGPPGRGLGLAIAKRVIDVHGGVISMRNLPAGGCEVEVELPLSAPALAGEGEPARVDAVRS